MFTWQNKGNRDREKQSIIYLASWRTRIAEQVLAKIKKRKEKICEEKQSTINLHIYLCPIICIPFFLYSHKQGIRIFFRKSVQHPVWYYTLLPFIIVAESNLLEIDCLQYLRRKVSGDMKCNGYNESFAKSAPRNLGSLCRARHLFLPGYILHTHESGQALCI